MRKVDELGRIVIPAHLRKKYGIKNGTAMEFSDTGNGLLIRNVEPLCRVCHKPLCEDAAFPLCNACLAEAAKRYQEKMSQSESL